MADEIDALDLPVTSTLPTDLVGRYIRNGPNPVPGHDPGHWFAGQGMLHGVRLAHGRAEWCRNRWVRTATFDVRPDARVPQPGGVIDRAMVTADTGSRSPAGYRPGSTAPGSPTPTTRSEPPAAPPAPPFRTEPA